MVFAEMMEDIDHKSTICDLVFERTMAFVEASYAQYESNIQEAELKVIKESGTKEDLNVLVEAAEEGFIVKAKKSIDKIINTLVEYIKSAKESISDFFTKKETDEKLGKIQSIIDKNPKAKSTKVKIIDFKKVDQTIDKYEADIRRKIALVKSGKATEKDKEDIANRKAQFIKDHKAAIASTVTVTLGAAVAFLGTWKKKASNIKVDMPEVDLTVESSVEDAQMAVGITDALSHATKVRMDSLKEGIRRTFSSIKGAFTGEKEIDVDIDGLGDKMMKNSFESVMSEDLDDILAEIIEEAEKSLDSSSNGEMVTAEKYLESLEAELFKDDEEVIEEKLDDAESIDEYLKKLEDEIESTKKNDETTTEESVSSIVDEIMKDLEDM